jgi:cell division septation protein DedD
MEEQTTWKGHTFTLLVFTGIVLLCSIFFILGMLVGRAEGQKVAGPGGASAKNEARAAPKEDKQDLSFYESLKKDEQPALQPGPARPDPAPPALEPPKKAVPDPEPAVSRAAPRAPANSVNYQVGAVSKLADAERLLNQVKKKGFPRTFILSPAEGDPKPLFKVQVGPFSDLLEAQDVKKKLENAGYQPMLKK